MIFRTTKKRFWTLRNLGISEMLLFRQCIIGTRGDTAVGTHEHSISVTGLGARAANERPTAGTAPPRAAR